MLSFHIFALLNQQSYQHLISTKQPKEQTYGHLKHSVCMFYFTFFETFVSNICSNMMDKTFIKLVTSTDTWPTQLIFRLPLVNVQIWGCICITFVIKLDRFSIQTYNIKWKTYLTKNSFNTPNVDKVILFQKFKSTATSRCHTYKNCFGTLGQHNLNSLFVILTL